MLHKLHTVNRLGLGVSEQVRRFTEDAEVDKIEIFGKQIKGSNNDNSGKEDQLGLVFGNEYVFRVTKFVNKNPTTIIPIKWEIRYNSVKKGKNIKLTTITLISSIKLNDNNFKDEEGDAIDLEDICGRMLFVKAYIKDKEFSNELRLWHHNRFHNIDRLIIEEQILTRQTSPYLINQSNTSLCGPASIFYIFAKYKPLDFYTFTKELFRTGRSKYNNFEVTPHKNAVMFFFNEF